MDPDLAEAFAGILDRELAPKPNAGDEYVPADIMQGDRDLATHCETFLCTEANMSREDRMKRITQSIADYREFHATRARRL